MYVSYASRYAGKPDAISKHAACFVGLPMSAQPDSIRYVASVNPILSRAACEAFAGFVCRLLPHMTARVLDYVTAEHVAMPPTTGPDAHLKHVIEWEVVTKGMPRTRALMYLTMARLVDEFGPLVAEWCKTALATPTSDDEALFLRLQEIHVEATEGKHPGIGIGSGHGLMYPARRGSIATSGGGWGTFAYGPISIAKLHERLGQTIASVHAHFAGEPSSMVSKVVAVVGRVFAPAPAPMPIYVPVQAPLVQAEVLAPYVPAPVPEFAFDYFVYGQQDAPKPVPAARPRTIAALKRALPRAPRVIKATRARA